MHLLQMAFIAFGLFVSTIAKAEISVLDENRLSPDTAQLRKLKELAYNSTLKYKLDSIKYYAKLGLKLAEKTGNNQYNSDYYRELGNYFRLKDDLNNAEKYYEKAIKIAKQNNQIFEQIRAGYAKSINYYGQGQHIKCLHQIYNNIDIAKKHNLQPKLFSTFQLLAILHNDYGNDSMARVFERVSNNLQKLPVSIFDIQSDSIRNRIKLELSKNNIKTAHKLLNSLRHTHKEGKTNVNQYYLGTVALSEHFFLKHEVSTAISLCLEAKKYYLENELPIEVIKSNLLKINNKLVKFYIEIGNIHQAIHEQKFCKQALKTNRIVKFQIEIIQNEAKINLITKNYKEAIENFLLAQALNDSVYKKKNAFELAFMQVQEEAKRKDLEIELLSKSVVVNKLELNTQRYLRNFLIVIFGLSLVILWLNRKNYRILAKQNHFNEHLLSIIGHDLRQPILGVISSFKISKPAEQAHVQLTKMNNLLLAVDNLLYWAAGQHKTTSSAEDENILDESISEVLELLDDNIIQKNIELTQTLDKNLKVVFNKNELRIVLQNVIQNAIKFSNEFGKIKIYGFSKKALFCLIVEDDGLGYTQSFKERKHQGTQIGLNLVRKLLEKNQGSFSIEDGPIAGTKVILHFKTQKP